MIERDTLTKLYTRRIGESKLKNTRMGFIEDGIKYQMVMGDIDHFKRFNDTYGHDCGDLVLQTVAGVLNRSMIGKGYAVRWGGEEFIIVYEDMDFEKAYEHLKEVREKVISEVVEYKGELLSITMTFGIVPGTEDELDNIIKSVDNLLYIGKEGGRDRIVRYDEYSEVHENGEVEIPAGSRTETKTGESENAQKPIRTDKNDTIPKETMSEEDRLEALMKSM
jgi:diguanylate cyclase (GGDEF)-like protein